jgi:predicted signal transduction protein with EAL and GGDEF domain
MGADSAAPDGVGAVSCGIAALVAMPQGLQRALAAAEIACKTAKTRGRSRIELYACEDQSMMRRQDDVVAVGQLRAAFKTDRLTVCTADRAPSECRITRWLRNPDASA